MEDEIKFYWDADRETYFASLKLEDNIARIFFLRNFGSIKKDKYLGEIWNVGLAIGRKKDIVNWYYGFAPSRINDWTTYKKYGIKVLIWAKKAIENFIENNLRFNSAIGIGAIDAQRLRVYTKGLSKLGFKSRTVKYGYNYDLYYNYVGENEFFYQKELVYIKRRKE